MKISRSFLILSIACLFSCTQGQKQNTSFKIALGSCNRTTLDQSIWSAIIDNDPDLFIWLGDIVYGDTHDMHALRAKYNLQKSFPEYQALLEQVPVIGVWDDHDYGWNDAGKGYSKKDSSKQLLLDFLEISETDEVRQREGIYTAYTYGEGTTQIKVILLDARYFRDTILFDPAPTRKYQPNPEGDILGETQWNWLERELKESTAAVHIIGSGIQFIPEEHGWEKWANLPKSRDRLFGLLNQYQPKATILVSGDRHIAEISEIKLSDNYTVTELTTSGLTHTWSGIWEEPNKYRVGEMVIKRNFGIIQVDFIGENPSVKLEVRGLADSLFKEHQILFQ